jgi:peptidoglycan hydrolase CwlO-like protein
MLNCGGMQTVKKMVVLVSIAALLLGGVSFISAQTSTDSRDVLEQQLAAIEAQITELQGQLTTTTKAKQQLQNKIKQLKTQAQVLQLKIKSITLTINKLNTNIATTEKEISNTTTKIDQLEDNLSVMLRLLNQQSEQGMLVPLLQSGGVSEMFDTIHSYYTLSDAVLNVVDELKQNKVNLNGKRVQLEGQHDDATELLGIETVQQVALANTLSEQKNLLTETQGQESEYAAMLADQKKRAAEIRNRIYELFESNKTVTFGQAVEIAQGVSKLTGVRAEFLLAILTQESNLGKNVGTCNRAGDPPEKSYTVVMKPDRNIEPFKTITSELGLDINTTPVSCPMKQNGKQIGWGGAMGPAQFIPSTWMGYRKRIASLAGKAVANPWDIRDAFLAAGIKLADAGATSQSGEWKAAMLYFSGSTNLRYRFYGDNVVATAEKYENDIKTLQNANAPQQ